MPKIKKLPKQVEMTPQTETIPIDHRKVFRDWLAVYSSNNKNEPLQRGDADVLKLDSEELLKNLQKCYYGSISYFDDLVNTVAYLNLKNPFDIIPALENLMQSDIFVDQINIHLNDPPKQWNISFLELLARVDSWDLEFFKCAWIGNSKTKFAEFASGSVSDSEHSAKFYDFIFCIFFGGDNLDDSLICKLIYDENSEERVKLVRGMIKMAKKGQYLWDFESFFHKT